MRRKKPPNPQRGNEKGKSPLTPKGGMKKEIKNVELLKKWGESEDN
jgi:hypothetical protein